MINKITQEQFKELESSLVQAAYVVSKKDGQIYLRTQAVFGSTPQLTHIYDKQDRALRYGQTLLAGFHENAARKHVDFAIAKDDSKEAVLAGLFSILQEEGADVVFVFDDKETPAVLTELDDGNYLVAILDGVLRVSIGFLKFMDGYKAFEKEMLQKAPRSIYDGAEEIVFSKIVKDTVESNVEAIPGYCYANDDDVGDMLCAFADGEITFPTLYNEFLDIYGDGYYLSSFSDVERFFCKVLRRLEEDDD